MRTARLLGRYRKMHIPDDPLFLREVLFHARRPGFRGLANPICEDRRADLLGPVVSGSGATDRPAGGGDSVLPDGDRLASLGESEHGSRQHNAWETIQRAHAVANGCYVAVANRIGHEKLCGDGIEFWGQSFVAGTSGEILAKAGSDREENLVVPIDLGQVDTTRTHWPFLRDRRIDAYGDLTRRLID